MAQVHPTAIVDSAAQFGEDVEIGPWCVIEGRVIIGDGCRLMHRVSLRGPLSLGKRNTLYPNACLGYAPQDRKFDPNEDGAGVVIGDDNIIREGVTIHRATGEHPTTVGDRNYLMADSHLGHDTRVGSDCMLANGALVGGHAEVGDCVILGGNAAVHQFCRVGRLAILSGVSAISQDLPPFCTSYTIRRVGSLNLVGLRRAGYQQHIGPLKQAFALLYRAGHPVSKAVEMINQQLGGDPLVAELVTFVQQSRRGITQCED